MTPIRLHYALHLDTSSCQDPEQAVKQFLEVEEFADLETTVEVVGGKYVVRYTIEGPATLTELRQALKHSAKALFSPKTQAAIATLKQRPSDFDIELKVRLPLPGLE